MTDQEQTFKDCPSKAHYSACHTHGAEVERKRILDWLRASPRRLATAGEFADNIAGGAIERCEARDA